MIMPTWTPPVGALAELTPSLRPLEAFKDQTIVLSGLDNTGGLANDAGPHSRMQAAWLTGSHARRTEGPDLQVGISMDQVAAAELSADTPLTSLELSVDFTDLAGSCNGGYSCAYTSTIAWRSPTMPLPMEGNPRAVFTRLFGGSETTDAAARRSQLLKHRSLLDSVQDKVAALKKELGPTDVHHLNGYLDSVRDVERRVQIAMASDVELPVVERPAGIPTTYEPYAKLMFDLLALAYQTDLTRVSTFMMACELSYKAYPEIGVPDAHHPLSHHGGNAESIKKLSVLNSFHMSMFAYFVEKLRAIPHGSGSLLDTTVVLFGSGMADPDQHSLLNCPTLLIGGRALGLSGGRHVRYPSGTPLANLHVSVLRTLGVPADHFGDSSGTIAL
jgi:hypothetical protein